ncbi:MAG: GNAT family N-acetyltransferase [Alicyclobacillus sp.]|nr:GNAT family N-acetyltransferase [Alicyclobacillus sp.]
MSLSIRQARPEEMLSIRSARLHAYEPYAAVQPDNWEDLRQSILSTSDQDENVLVLVAEVDHQLAGSVVLYPAQQDAYDGRLAALPYPEIRMLAVSEGYRKQGIGEALVKACVECARSRGEHAVGLHTGSFMESALRLYSRLGFRRVPELDFHPTPDVTVMAFRLNLAE